MTSLLKRLFGNRGDTRTDVATAPSASHLIFPEQPAAVYAIGDIHGCLDLLRALEARIVADAGQFTGERWIVVLGDFVDRGPQSAAVIDHLMRPPPSGLKRLVLKGNHEAMMLAFLKNPHPRSDWLDAGGRETLASYGVPVATLARRLSARTMAQLLHSYVPVEHVEFLKSLPSLIETPLNLLVHAGLRPGVPIGRQAEMDLLWYRDDFTQTFEGYGKTVVHGHQMRDTPLVTQWRVGVDTGAYVTGRLFAARLTADRKVTLLSSDEPVAD